MERNNFNKDSLLTCLKFYWNRTNKNAELLILNFNKSSTVTDKLIIINWNRIKTDVISNNFYKFSTKFKELIYDNLIGYFFTICYFILDFAYFIIIMINDFFNFWELFSTLNKFYNFILNWYLSTLFDANFAPLYLTYINLNSYFNLITIFKIDFFLRQILYASLCWFYQKIGVGLFYLTYSVLDSVWNDYKFSHLCWYFWDLMYFVITPLLDKILIKIQSFFALITIELLTQNSLWLYDSFFEIDSILKINSLDNTEFKILNINEFDNLNGGSLNIILEFFKPTSKFKITKNMYLTSYLNNSFVNKETLENIIEIGFKSEYFNVINRSDFKYNFIMESSANQRFQKFNNPIFKYDYKSGDYFPKLYRDLYTHLFSTLIDLTSGLRTAPWFYSTNFFENFILESRLSVDFLLFNKNMQNAYTSPFHVWDKSKFFHTCGFNNFFNTLMNENVYLNKRWMSFNSINQKFYRMLLTSSMQQRIYSNWRQLKFTREAWRCKLLASRHQKTLYKRYVNEDGVFWSIERNAKDLLPGWAMITPFSSHTRFTAIGKVDIGLMGVLLVLNSSIISGANFLVTYRYLSTLNNRKMRDARAFFAEGVMVASWMMIAANPMLIIGIVMLLSDRHWQTSFFDYSGGGDTVLFQHMFWFFGHPEVYIIMIPVFGFTNTIISYYLKKRVSARASLLYSMYTIAFLGFFVWGHHMYMVGLAHTTRMLFSTLTVMISVPAATKLMHWCVTLANSSFTMEIPFLFILTFVFFFVSGGISGMCVAHTGMDILFHDTFYVIGHFHVMLAGSAMFGSFGAFYFYFTAIFGVKFSRIYAYLHYTYYLLGQFMTVIPMFWLGYAGMPRRVLDYPASMGGWHSVISAGHLLSVAGLIAFFIMIFDSLRQSRASTRNTFGINRYNTCLNFYLYEISRLIHVSRKNNYLFRYIQPYSLQLNKLNYKNFEYLETTLYSYLFVRK